MESSSESFPITTTENQSEKLNQKKREKERETSASVENWEIARLSIWPFASGQILQIDKENYNKIK